MSRKLTVRQPHQMPPKKPTYALVLLSGGMDSVAALHWALAQDYAEVRAIGFAYGQPHRVAELTAAGLTAKRLGVPFTMLELGESIRGLKPLLFPSPGRDTSGISRANIPLRNLTLVSIAACEAVRAWPGGDVDLVGGWNADDFAGFPDCRESFFDAAMCAVRSGLVGVTGWLSLKAPWKGSRKTEIVAWAQERGVLDDLRGSMSCYGGTRCGQCDACTLRASAFATAGVEDGTAIPPVAGGDRHREQ